VSNFGRIQLLTIRELLEGNKPQLPPFVLPTYEKAANVQIEVGTRNELSRVEGELMASAACGN
jgi:hypothetical protein